MALIIPVNYAQVILPLTHALLARPAAITYGINTFDTGGDYVTAADDQVVAFHNAGSNELDSQVTIGPATLRVGQDGGDPLSVEGSFTEVGDESGAMMPPNSNLLVKKQTALGGRRGRGRCFVPWVLLDAAVSDAGQIDSGSLSVRQDDCNAWLSALTDTGIVTNETPMYLLHDSRGAGTEPGPSLVTALTCPALIAVQNRRIGRG
jgi:hypothetical protein